MHRTKCPFPLPIALLGCVVKKAAFTVMAPGDGEKEAKLSMTEDADSTPLSLLLLFAWETNTSHDMPLGALMDMLLLPDMLLFTADDDNLRTS
mmetsp:Transcript_13242/g.20604  ORF Transcript_13242/g.20604 Transcript_13242/m.20604 type:complete len:93 (-) Transcript_13242:152-430(-)